MGIVMSGGIWRGIGRSFDIHGKEGRFEILGGGGEGNVLFWGVRRWVFGGGSLEGVLCKMRRV